MKLRIGTSVLFLLQARAPSTAFSSPLSSYRFWSSTFTFIARGGGSSDSNSIFNKKNKIERKATISPEGASKVENTKNNSNDESGDGNNNDIDSTLKEQIIKAAMGAIDITGPSTFADNFAGIPYVNTSKLQNSSPRQHRVLFVLGGPGAGKGTQSENIVSEYKCIHLSVGELLRKERQRGDESPHAELIEKFLVAGQIVPVEISLGLVRNAMDEAVTGESDEKAITYGQPIFLVDGFPRNYDNLSGWTDNMPNHATCIGSLVYDCPIDVLEQRILSRAETSGRSDDNLESARKRFKTFQDQTMPVVNALEEVEKMQLLDETGGNDISKLHVHHIAGEGTMEEVWDATKEAMNGYVKNDVLSANAQLLQAIEKKDIPTYASLTMLEMLSISQDEEDTALTNVKEANMSNDIDFKKVEDAFKLYEVLDECTGDIVNHISNSQIETSSGTKAVVSYDRRIEDKATGEIKSEFRETRVWSHDSKGWICIHFVRKPIADE